MGHNNDNCTGIITAYVTVFSTYFAVTLDLILVFIEICLFRSASLLDLCFATRNLVLITPDKITGSEIVETLTPVCHTPDAVSVTNTIRQNTDLSVKYHTVNLQLCHVESYTMEVMQLGDLTNCLLQKNIQG